MCLKLSQPRIEYKTPAAPEPTPESVAPPGDTERDSLKISRKGLTSKRTDLNVPTLMASTGTSGQGLNVPV